MMAHSRKDVRSRHAWVRAAVIVVLLLGLTSLIVSALVSAHRPAPQQTSDSFGSPQAQSAQTAVSYVIPAVGVSFSGAGLKNGNAQTSSIAMRNPVSTTNRVKLSSQPKKKSQAVKAAAKPLKKQTAQTNAKARTAKAQGKQVKRLPSSTTPSDELFPELRKH